jgi:hypothetical protein
MRLRDRIRVLLLFTPWVSVPLALLGVFLAVTYPVGVLLGFGWIVAVVGVAGAVALGAALRSRYRVSILDSSPLGVVSWLQRRR